MEKWGLVIGNMSRGETNCDLEERLMKIWSLFVPNTPIALWLKCVFRQVEPDGDKSPRFVHLSTCYAYTFPVLIFPNKLRKFCNFNVEEFISDFSFNEASFNSITETNISIISQVSKKKSAKILMSTRSVCRFEYIFLLLNQDQLFSLAKPRTISVLCPTRHWSKTCFCVLLKVALPRWWTWRWCCESLTLPYAEINYWPATEAEKGGESCDGVETHRQGTISPKLYSCDNGTIPLMMD